jgi:hypothetical protein
MKGIRWEACGKIKLKSRFPGGFTEGNLKFMNLFDESCKKLQIKTGKVKKLVETAGKFAKLGKACQSFLWNFLQFSHSNPPKTIENPGKIPKTR